MLIDVWPLARGIRVLVSKDLLDNEAIDWLADVFKDAIKDMEDKKKKEKMEKSIQILEKIKLAEQSSWSRERGEIEDLSKMIEDI